MKRSSNRWISSAIRPQLSERLVAFEPIERTRVPGPGMDVAVWSRLRHRSGVIADILKELTVSSNVQYAGFMSNNMERRPSTTHGGPLSDLRVLELGTLIAGPFAGRLFADFGAEVIKVEHPDRGDPLRSWGMTWNGTDSLWHLIQSRGKLSVTADLHDPADQSLVRQLAIESDVLIENFRPGRLERWNLDPEDLMEANPGLIVVRISGYGQTGPMRDQPAFGTIAEAASGLRFITGEPDLPPTRVGLSLGDSIASLHAVIGALVALHERHASGRGQMVDVALTESIFSMLEGILPEFAYHGAVRRRTGNIAHNSAPTNAYPCSDGSMVCIAANTTGLFRVLCRILGRDDYATDSSLATNEGRVARGAEIDEAIAAWTMTRTADEVVEILRDQHVPVSRINSIADIVSDPQFQARDVIVEVVDHRLERPLLVPGVVPRLSRTPGVVPSLAQDLGESTDEVRNRLQAGEPEHQVGQRGIR
jgi:succinyl-CoA---D-citramalate CoA-transferase